MRRLTLALLVAAVLSLSTVALDVVPAAACSCALAGDREQFARADAVFVGEVREYAAPDPMVTSADPAVWTFAVHRVSKGDVARIQPVVSEFSGASCGLEIPKQGEFLVFATKQSFGISPEPAAGQLYAGLCGGTRATTDGALEAGLAPRRAPGPAPPVSPVGEAPAPTGGSDGFVAVVVGASVLALGAGLTIVLLRRRAIGRRAGP